MARRIYRTLIEPSFNTVALLGDATEYIGQTFTLLSEVLLAAAYWMDFCSHLIDAAAKAIGIFWLNSLSTERQKTKSLISAM